MSFQMGTFTEFNPAEFNPAGFLTDADHILDEGPFSPEPLSPLPLEDILQADLTPCVSPSESEESENEDEESGDQDEESGDEEKDYPEAEPLPVVLTKTKSTTKTPKSLKAKAPKTKAPKTKALKIKAPKAAKASKGAKAPKVKGPKAPRKALAPKKTPVKRTIRRPYKAMPLEKLTSKQEVTELRFNLIKSRFLRLQNQLERFNDEIALRGVVAEEEKMEEA